MHYGAVGKFLSDWNALRTMGRLFYGRLSIGGSYNIGFCYRYERNGFHCGFFAHETLIFFSIIKSTISWLRWELNTPNKIQMAKLPIYIYIFFADAWYLWRSDLNTIKNWLLIKWYISIGSTYEAPVLFPELPLTNDEFW